MRTENPRLETGRAGRLLRFQQWGEAVTEIRERMYVIKRHLENKIGRISISEGKTKEELRLKPESVT